ncbi:MAG: hypothetical protein BMS9Abin36_0538 [Gammaproteobacteria bacterium]|nr:MAG: hypothetical protein BMS9Abin36_0538 [Gammaproteobacteria bacterium]
MTKSRRMLSVVRMAKHKEQDSARSFGLAQKRLADARKLLDELVVYRDEYMESYSAVFSSGAALGKLQEYRKFLGDLNLAIGAQQQKIAQGNRIVNKEKRQWMDSYSRRRVLSNVQTRYEGQERVESDKREQRELEQLTQRYSKPSF